jgi:hypothetical protein
MNSSDFYTCKFCDGPSAQAAMLSNHLDLGGFVLPVLQANAQEIAAHEDVLTQIDKSSGGKTIWREAHG